MIRYTQKSLFHNLLMKVLANVAPIRVKKLQNFYQGQVNDFTPYMVIVISSTVDITKMMKKYIVTNTLLLISSEYVLLRFNNVVILSVNTRSFNLFSKSVLSTLKVVNVIENLCWFLSQNHMHTQGY